jgi:hypothetical protein
MIFQMNCELSLQVKTEEPVKETPAAIEGDSAMVS